ncbi:DUF6121 family protein [Agromyces marinus]|uniref:Tryptophan-associated transmembrane protein (Trp_oprn_chp) n=2 Tax=Agromyces marinus TaxID=1389020 RepID=A0ABM8H3W3_9MICO|nr:DUF6121 family protein [Agromyces marinus]BDZ55497.1 hypothetical protein GCM10025870_25700 [Agromyces marinus]
MGSNSSSAWAVAGFATALLVAIVVAAFGFLSLLADLEPVGDPAAGILVGPATVAGSVGAFLLLAGTGLTRGLRTWSLAGLALLATWAGGILAGTIAYAASTGTVLAAFLFALAFMTVGFGAIIPVAAALVAVLASATVRAQRGGVERPRWPWERDDDL